MVKSRVMDFLYYIIISILVVYALMSAYLYLFQRSILYIPVKEMSAPANYGLTNMEEVKIKTNDGINLTAWYAKPKEKESVMLYLHGNAGNLGDRTEKISNYLNAGFGILALSWRGFGSSEGEPSEQGLYNDARSAIKYLQNLGYKDKQIFLYGESLGSGVAVQMATEHDFLALILEAPYTSISNRAAELYPYIPVKLLLKDHFDSISKISKVKTPVLIFHGYLDDVMPISHGRRMLEAANEPKEVRFFEHTGHTDFDFELLSKIMHEFVHKW